MTLNEYQRAAMRTSAGGINHVLNGCMGLCGESGECIDLLKKHHMQGHPIDVDKMIDELGDVLWYAAELATGLNKTLQDVAEHNLRKLQHRYPDGFEPERSLHRETA